MFRAHSGRDKAVNSPILFKICGFKSSQDSRGLLAQSARHYICSRGQFPAIWRPCRPLLPAVCKPSTSRRLLASVLSRRSTATSSLRASRLPVRDCRDPELRRHQTLHGAAELASDRSRCTGKISLSDFPGAAVSSKTSLVQDHFFSK